MAEVRQESRYELEDEDEMLIPDSGEWNTAFWKECLLIQLKTCILNWLVTLTDSDNIEEESEDYEVDTSEINTEMAQKKREEEKIGNTDSEFESQTMEEKVRNLTDIISNLCLVEHEYQQMEAKEEYSTMALANNIVWNNRLPYSNFCRPANQYPYLDNKYRIFNKLYEAHSFENHMQIANHREDMQPATGQKIFSCDSEATSFMSKHGCYSGNNIEINNSNLSLASNDSFLSNWGKVPVDINTSWENTVTSTGFDELSDLNKKSRFEETEGSEDEWSYNFELKNSSQGNSQRYSGSGEQSVEWGTFEIQTDEAILETEYEDNGSNIDIPNTKLKFIHFNDIVVGEAEDSEFEDVEPIESNENVNVEDLWGFSEDEGEDNNNEEDNNDELEEYFDSHDYELVLVEEESEENEFFFTFDEHTLYEQ